MTKDTQEPQAERTEFTQLGWKVPTRVKEEFTEFVGGVGGIVQEDCAGALTIWRYLPAEIREQAKLAAKGRATVEVAFWEDLRDGLRVALRAQANILRERLEKKK